MSHEIRTPMNGMLVTAELLAASSLPDKLHRKANIIIKSGQSLLTIINDILDFSKIEAGKLELESTHVEPMSLIDDAISLFAERATSKGVTLTGYVAPDIPQAVAGDPVRITQILTNLLNNALKFTDTGHVAVRLTTDRQDQTENGTVMLRFDVEDTGIGIAQNKLDKIFDAFAQADSSTTRTHGGTGIGLTICRRLIKAMQGKISAQSEPGKGTTFTVCLPFPILTPTAVHTDLRQDCAPVAVALTDTAQRRNVMDYLTACGYAAEAIDGSDADFDTRKSYSAIIVTPETLATFSDVARNNNTKSEPTRIVVSTLGKTSATRLVESGEADFELLAPICANDIYSLLKTLPKGRAGARALQHLKEKPNQVATTKFNGLSVLAVDDSVVNREVLSEVLERLNVRVRCAENGREAVARAKAERFDAIFMDGSMPEMDGFEATAEIRKIEAEKNSAPTKIIAVTAHVVGEIADKWRSCGMDAYITKPFTLTSIESCLQQFFADRIDTGRAETSVTSDPNAAQPANVTEDQDDMRRPSESALLDDSVLDEIITMQGPDGGLAQRVVTLFCDHAPTARHTLLALPAEAPAEDLAAAAHALKSMCRNVGALALGNLCEQIESNAHAGAKNILHAENQHLLNQLLPQTIEALEQRIANLKHDGEDTEIESVSFEAS